MSVVERPEDPDRFLTLVTPEKNLIPRLGVLALELDDELRRASGSLRGTRGRAGGRPLRRLRHATTCGPATSSMPSTASRCSGLAELRSAVSRPAPGEPLVLHVERGGRLIYLVIEAE